MGVGGWLGGWVGCVWGAGGLVGWWVGRSSVKIGNSFQNCNKSASLARQAQRSGEFRVARIELNKEFNWARTELFVVFTLIVLCVSSLYCS